MRHLLDTQVLIWYVDQHKNLSATALAAINNPQNDLFLSAASIWEIAIKIGNKKLNLSLPYAQWMKKAITDLRLATLPISVEYSDIQAALPPHHGDPFDRMLIAQALTEKVAIISVDVQFDVYGVTRIW
jgi:PIN domain nuclease of toxin-antitoxin system